MKKLINLCTIYLCCFVAASVLGQSTSSVKGRVVGASEGHGLRAILSNEKVLLDVVPDTQGNFIFGEVEPGDYVLKVNGIGYDTGESRSVIVVSPDTGSTPNDELVFQVSKLPSDNFQYQWEEDSSPAGTEISSYVNNPVEVEILGKMETVKDQNYHQRLWKDYSVVVSDEQGTWNQEYANRLLETLDQIFLAYYDQN